MNPILTVRTLGLVVRRGETRDIVRELTRRIHSDEVSYILRRDLAMPLTRRLTPKIPITVRPLAPGDVPMILEERPRRLPALSANIPTCYVAVTDDGSICYMQWLVGAEHQDRIRPFFKGELRVFHSDTVLLEFAYTFQRFRGLGIMAAAMAQIAERGGELGARWAITYVQSDNVASLKGCSNAGFRPYMRRYERWRGMRLTERFEALPSGFKYPFE
jgi:GNAT superfamily N-acetyltransferase